MKNTLFLIAIFLLVACAKEEFAANKASQNSAINAVASTSLTSCAQHTLVSPKVDILMLWDNSSSALFINSATKASMGSLISSVSEKFDYHILSAPLISSNSNTLNEASLILKDSASVSGTASGIVKTKDSAIASLGFSQATGSMEFGVDRATAIIEANKANGIFRSDAYTIIVLMSNGDDTSCELATGYNSCATKDWNALIDSKINKLLCIRGSAPGINCSGTSSLNSTMMRFINISALTSCSTGLGKVNSRYRKVAKTIYETNYTNGWPTSNDNLNPFVSGGVAYPDNYDICSIDFNHIFDGVNTAIKQTLVKHVYDFWPVAGTNDSVDATTLVVRKTDGTVLTHQADGSTPANGYTFIGNQVNHSTRSFPTAGENFTGKMIQLFGSNGADKVIYPECLSITYNTFKAHYGYIYLQNGKPDVTTIEVYVNGVKVVQNATNGWDYLGLQFTSALDANYKVANLPNGTTSGYFLRLNGTAKFDNTNSSSVTVYYTSAP